LLQFLLLPAYHDTPTEKASQVSGLKSHHCFYAFSPIAKVIANVIGKQMAWTYMKAVAPIVVIAIEEVGA